MAVFQFFDVLKFLIVFRIVCATTLAACLSFHWFFVEPISMKMLGFSQSGPW